MAVAQCPASCGELIQGWILGSEKLVSCPVDWYSTVEVETGVPRKDERPLSRAMVDQLLAHWGYPPALSQQIRITLHSTIPVAKGMASSTADIAATAVATAHHLGHLLDEPTLARLCVALEPTDSTLFRQLTLRTTDYHQLPREPGLLANASRLQLAWEKVQQACHCGSPQLLGEAATISAIASQQLLPKPGFDALLDLVESAGLYGLNVAHSGSVVGLLLDRRRHDVEFLQWRLADSDIAAHWPQQHLLAMVPGGVILQ